MRLFVAAELDEPSRSVCAAVAERLRAQGWPGRWVPPQNYHLTAAFLGTVDPERLPEIVAAVRKVAARIPSLGVPLDVVGAFPNARRPRVVWVGPHAPVPAFGTLCGIIRDALNPLGFTFDPHADAHVTLARAVGPTTALPGVEPARIGPLRVASVTLYESHNAHGGTHYVALEHFPLRRAASGAMISRAARPNS
jgi:2'-5' RNA ligase